MKKMKTIAMAVIAGTFAGMASAAGTGNLWGNTYADYKTKGSDGTTVLGVEGGFTNSQGGAWAGLEQNVTDDIQWVGIGGNYKIHGELSVFGATEYERGDNGYSWSMYKGGLSYGGIAGENWSVTPYAGYKWESNNSVDSNDAYAIVGASASYKLAPNFTTFVSVDGSAKDTFVTEVDVGATYNIPNIPGAYLTATYEYDFVGSVTDSGVKLRAGYRF
ncbi:MAG: hypothetical protein ACRDCE_12700 [Cetobacterium sp.]|uniref:hypothetical protein n=1 Tax=Cetobacterium sp. TaxID=2071632 RepID=UPI003EE6AC9F